MLTAKAIDHLVLNVEDVEASARWYENVLGMKRAQTEPKENGERRTFLLFGAQKINLRPKTASQAAWFTAKNPEAGSADLCFLVDLAPRQVVAHLQAQGVAIETGPVTKQGAQGEIHSVYCRDPDGSLIELSSY
ncbi:VOC family protein [Asaia lannensis]|uniref:VOC family protein n=1 Tax=Asaia lannensis TaxID=415421 RepID=UPI001C98F18D